MNWQTFKNLLTENRDLKLQFLHSDNLPVRGGYHITEIKQNQITSVDCGGTLNAWTEIVVQVVEPGLATGEEPMAVLKAMKIVHVVENQLPLPGKAEVKIEFGNADTPVQQMPVSGIETDNENLWVSLVPDQTQCKAAGEGQKCGLPKGELAGVAEKETACCTPGGGCC